VVVRNYEVDLQLGWIIECTDGIRSTARVRDKTKDEEGGNGRIEGLALGD
jgi:hypothetical protein